MTQVQILLRHPASRRCTRHSGCHSRLGSNAYRVPAVTVCKEIDADLRFLQKDQAVKLPCVHIFGEQCILTWAQGTTPHGRYNSCPNCLVELLPPSMYSRFSALGCWLQAFIHVPRPLTLGLVLEIVVISARQFPDSQICGLIKGALDLFLLVYWFYWVAKLCGWRWMLFTSIFSIGVTWVRLRPA